MAEQYCTCPYCHAVFRVPEENYREVSEMARCGNCREVFNRNEHRVTASTAPTLHTPTRDQTPPAGNLHNPFVAPDMVVPPHRTTANPLERMRPVRADGGLRWRARPLVGLVWLVVAGAFVLLLGLQIKYFMVAKYAQHDNYRPFLAVFCVLAGCRLAPRQAAHQFTLTHTQIELHPTAPGALRITVKLVNGANFTQPYPHLLLTLTDRGGRVVGKRTFTPDLYLPPDTRNQIPSQQLATVLFDLARPHEKAVGFVVKIVGSAS